MPNVTISKVTVNANPGSEIGDCLDSLVCIAIAFNCEAILVHNNKKYTTTATKIISTIIEE